MVTATGTDPGDDIDGTTFQIHLPTSSKAGVYSATIRPGTMSGLLAAALSVAVVLTVILGALIAAEETRDAVSSTMLLAVVWTAVAWIAVALVLLRDRADHRYRALHSSCETIQAREQELFARQEHLAHRFADLANRQAEATQLLRQLAADMAAVRRDMADVIGVADADAELSIRQAAVNESPPVGPGLYVVPPEN